MIIYTLGTQDFRTGIYLYDIETAKEIELVSAGDKYFYSFTWSPDKIHVAVQADFHPPINQIMVLNIDSKELSTLIFNKNYENWWPAWSPDGKQIAFTSDRFGAENLFIMNIDGTDLTQVTKFTCEAANWSPDGKRIAFQSDMDGNLQLYSMDTDGANLIRLTENSAKDYAPVWSPDGNKILFGTDRDGNMEVYVMNADGSNPTNLTNNPSDDIAGSWSPDGKHIVFNSYRSPESQIYIMDADGANVTLLPTGSNANSPMWSP